MVVEGGSSWCNLQGSTGLKLDLWNEPRWRVLSNALSLILFFLRANGSRDTRAVKSEEAFFRSSRKAKLGKGEEERKGNCVKICIFLETALEHILVGISSLQATEAPLSFGNHRDLDGVTRRKRLFIFSSRKSIIFSARHQSKLERMKTQKR